MSNQIDMSLFPDGICNKKPNNRRNVNFDSNGRPYCGGKIFKSIVQMFTDKPGKIIEYEELQCMKCGHKRRSRRLSTYITPDLPLIKWSDDFKNLKTGLFKQSQL